jgi:C4-dicarboxylate-specific signal transduction histidine kinase
MAWNEIRHRARLVKDYGDVPPVWATEARLGQVFLNVLINAAHALQVGRADSNRIAIITRTDSQGRAVVEIVDTGSGILPENLPRLFTPFFSTKPLGPAAGWGWPSAGESCGNWAERSTCAARPGKGPRWW